MVFITQGWSLPGVDFCKPSLESPFSSCTFLSQRKLQTLRAAKPLQTTRAPTMASRLSLNSQGSAQPASSSAFITCLGMVLLPNMTFFYPSLLALMLGRWFDYGTAWLSGSTIRAKNRSLCGMMKKTRSLESGCYVWLFGFVYLKRILGLGALGTPTSLSLD